MKIDLSAEDALLFVEFQKNYRRFQDFEEFQEMFNVMKKAEVFSLKNGKAILNFNRFGQLADIEVQYHTYRVA